MVTHAMVPCGHSFCGECLAEWLSKKSDCPTCRCGACLGAASVLRCCSGLLAQRTQLEQGTLCHKHACLLTLALFCATPHAGSGARLPRCATTTWTA